VRPRKPTQRSRSSLSCSHLSGDEGEKERLSYRSSLLGNPELKQGGAMEIRRMWTMIATICCLSKRGDKWVAKVSEGSKVILLDKSSRHSVEPGMKVPVDIAKEIESCMFGRIETGIFINGRGVWLPLDIEFENDRAVLEAAKVIKKKWDEDAEKHKAEAAKYAAEQAERKLVVERLLDLATRKPAGNYMSRIQKRDKAPLTSEEKETIRAYFQLPPWGVTDRGEFIVTDSCTD